MNRFAASATGPPSIYRRQQAAFVVPVQFDPVAPFRNLGQPCRRCVGDQRSGGAGPEEQRADLGRYNRVDDGEYLGPPAVAPLAPDRGSNPPTGADHAPHFRQRPSRAAGLAAQALADRR